MEPTDINNTFLSIDMDVIEATACDLATSAAPDTSHQLPAALALPVLNDVPAWSAFTVTRERALHAKLLTQSAASRPVWEGGPAVRDRAADARKGLQRKGSKTTSAYRGVTHHTRTGRWEAHIWLGGKQMYLGGFDDEPQAALAYDVAAVKFRGLQAQTNFALAPNYHAELIAGPQVSADELVSHLRLQSRSATAHRTFSSAFRGVTCHAKGKWEARIGRSQAGFGGEEEGGEEEAGAPKRKYRYLGLFNSEVEAAMAYDRAAVLQAGLAAATNFDPSLYVALLRPAAIDAQLVRTSSTAGSGTAAAAAAATAVSAAAQPRPPDAAAAGTTVDASWCAQAGTIADMTVAAVAAAVTASSSSSGTSAAAATAAAVNAEGPAAVAAEGGVHGGSRFAEAELREGHLLEAVQEAVGQHSSNCAADGDANRCSSPPLDAHAMMLQMQEDGPLLQDELCSPLLGVGPAGMGLGLGMDADMTDALQGSIGTGMLDAATASWHFGPGHQGNGQVLQQQEQQQGVLRNDSNLSQYSSWGSCGNGRTAATPGSPPLRHGSWSSSGAVVTTAQIPFGSASVGAMGGVTAAGGGAWAPGADYSDALLPPTHACTEHGNDSSIAAATVGVVAAGSSMGLPGLVPMHAIMGIPALAAHPFGGIRLLQRQQRLTLRQKRQLERQQKQQEQALQDQQAALKGGQGRGQKARKRLARATSAPANALHLPPLAQLHAPQSALPAAAAANTAGMAVPQHLQLGIDSSSASSIVRHLSASGFSMAGCLPSGSTAHEEQIIVAAAMQGAIQAANAARAALHAARTQSGAVAALPLSATLIGAASSARGVGASSAGMSEGRLAHSLSHLGTTMRVAPPEAGIAEERHAGGSIIASTVIQEGAGVASDSAAAGARGQAAAVEGGESLANAGASAATGKVQAGSAAGVGSGERPLQQARMSSGGCLVLPPKGSLQQGRWLRRTAARTASAGVAAAREPGTEAMARMDKTL